MAPLWSQPELEEKKAMACSELYDSLPPWLFTEAQRKWGRDQLVKIYSAVNNGDDFSDCAVLDGLMPPGDNFASVVTAVLDIVEKLVAENQSFGEAKVQESSMPASSPEIKKRTKRGGSKVESADYGSYAANQRYNRAKKEGVGHKEAKRISMIKGPIDKTIQKSLSRQAARAFRQQ